MQTLADLKNKMRQRICEIVNASGPMRTTQVLADIASEFCGGTHGVFEVPATEVLDHFSDILEQCIEEEGIVELEFIRADTSYKISSLLFPMGTVFHDWRGEKSGTIRNDLKKGD